jgi:DNA-binding response OmpR family regulator
MRILLVDDEEAIFNCIEAILVSEGHQVWACLLDNEQSAERVVSLARFMRFDIALIDLLMPTVTGDILAARLRQVAPSTRLVMLVRRGSMGRLLYDREVIDDFVLEPFERDELIKALYRA